MAISLFNVSKLLVQLLQVHNRVLLPGVGAFIAEYQSAAIVNDGKTLLPPSKSLIFRANEKWDDGFLEIALAQQDQISQEEAKQQLTQFTQEILSLLKEGNQVEFPDFGTLRKTSEGIYLFEKDADVNLLAASFGLPEIEMTPLQVVPIETPPAIVPEKIYKPIEPIKKKEEKPKKKRGYWWLIVVIILLAVAAYIAHSVYVFYQEEAKMQQEIEVLSAWEKEAQERLLLQVEQENELLPDCDSIPEVE